MCGVQLAVAGFLGMTGVAAGAYGSHGLKGRVSEDRIRSFLTASHYQVVHSTAMLAVSILQRLLKDHPKAVGHLRRAFYGYASGVVLFSGSIYWLVLGGPRALGPLTPVGGLAIMAGWGFVILAGLCL